MFVSPVSSGGSFTSSAITVTSMVASSAVSGLPVASLLSLTDTVTWWLALAS